MENRLLGHIVDAIHELSEDTPRWMVTAAFARTTDPETARAHSAVEVDKAIADMLAVATEDRYIHL